MGKSGAVELGATVLMAGCALLMTGMYLWNQTKTPPDPNAPVYIENWRDYATGEMRFGATSGRVTLVEFSDFQCPYCAQLSSSLHDLRARYPQDLEVIYRNFPLARIHPYARDAALAAHCSAGIGRFESLHDYFFSNVDSLGVEPLGSMAVKAGIVDTLALSSCMASSDAAAAITADSAAAMRLGVGGTPTVLINGWLYAGAPSLTTLDSVISAVLSTSE